MADLDVISLKKKANDAIEESTEALHQLSDKIWANPELLFEEVKAHNLLCSFLESRKFNVTRNYKLDTAFRAEIGDESDGPNIAVLCEYDALPEIGHACGHNLIAETGVAAALGIQAAFESVGSKRLGKLTVLGTPAEEGGGGKVILLEAGAFDDVDVSLMAHPKHCDNAEVKYLANDWLNVAFEGKAAHAAAAPWDGRNALDAAVLAYQNISCLRQQMRPTWRIHGVITNGGSKTNIIPDRTEVLFQIRAPTRSELAVLLRKAKGCFDAAATATGCEIKYLKQRNAHCYLNVINNEALERTYRQNGEGLGIHYVPVDAAGSTDMGNVSFKVPAIHPAFGINTGAKIHTREFAVAAGSADAQPYALKQGKVLAGTALDIYTNQQLLREIQEGFKDDMMHN